MLPLDPFSLVGDLTYKQSFTFKSRVPVGLAGKHRETEKFAVRFEKEATLCGGSE